jgi:GT2 family glycosyltransferase
MQVSFVIPLYNCLPLTKAMLVSLRETVPVGLTHEIILVDDGSTDGTREWLSTLGNNCHAIFNEKNLGFAATCNRGAATALG